MSDDLADVTVIVPAWCAADTIGRALASVAAQTLRPRAVVVVDDGSPDGTAAAAEACRDRLQRTSLTVIRQDNAGAGAARNRALAEAETTYLAFLDADDEWLPDHLRFSLRWIAENDFVLSAHNEWLVEDGRERLNDSASRLAERSDPYVALYCKGCISTSTVVVRREAAEEAGGFDPTLPNGQDVDLWLAILRRPGTRFGISHEPLSRYFINAAGVNAQTARRFRYFLLIARRWAPEIAARQGGGIRALWFRMAAIHLEACRSFMKSDRTLAALAVCLRLPVNLAHITVSAFASRTEPRRDFLQAVRATARPS